MGLKRFESTFRENRVTVSFPVFFLFEFSFAGERTFREFWKNTPVAVNGLEILANGFRASDVVQ